MSNLGWLFYKEYFRGIDYTELDNEKNEQIINKKVQTLITQSVSIEEAETLGNTHFKATTTYPGLILGSGNAHELPDVKGQAILGFSFDYTSGLPVIAGSSIKGVLRSAFKHPEYVQELLESEVDVKALEAEIFDNGDVFFDATIIGSSSANILGDDYITPHGDALKNPIPLRFIKVLPNVTFRFDFELSSGLISKSKKSKLFQDILADLGLGAKTNVGYGKFDGFKKEQTAEEAEEEKKEREAELYNEAIKEGSLEKLEAFKRDFPKSSYNIDDAISQIKHNEKIADIKRAFDNLDKSNKRHVESFIKKYKDNEDAQEFIAELKNSSSQASNKSSAKGIEALSEISSDKEFKAILHAHSSFSDEDRALVKENILRIFKDLNKKKSKKFLRDIKLKKYLGNDFEKEIESLIE
jgi:CRISPR-associated protein Cmr6